MHVRCTNHSVQGLKIEDKYTIFDATLSILIETGYGLQLVEPLIWII